MLTRLLHYYTLLSKEFLLFSTIPILIKTVILIRTTITVCLMVFFTIYALEDMRTWLTNLSSCIIYFYIQYYKLYLSIFGNIRVTT